MTNKISIVNNTMTDDQMQAYNVALSGENIFVTGGAGTGKSYLLRRIVEGLHQQKKQVIICAPTNAAAVLIGGTTIHRAFGFPVGVCISPARKTIIKRVNKALCAADVVIIDEISMVRIDLMDAIAASIHKAEEKNGKKIQIIVMGDFCQLPPVIDENTNDRAMLTAYYHKNVGRGYAFQAPGWEECRFIPIILRETMRQADNEMIGALNMLRTGDERCIEFFNQKSSRQHVEGAISLYPRNEDVDQYNLIELSKIQEQEYVFYPIISGVGTGSGAKNGALHLKKGAKVLMTKNESEFNRADHVNGPHTDAFFLQEERFIHYHNGSTGTVLSIGKDKDPMKDYVVVQITGGDVVILYREKFEEYEYTEKNGRLERKTACTYYQFPLKLGYAATIHRSQGQTYDRVNIDPDCWDAGQLYVAMSRVRDITQLHLIHRIRASTIVCDPLVQEFYDRIQNEEVDRYPSDMDSFETGGEPMKSPYEHFAVYNHKIIMPYEQMLIRKFIVLVREDGTMTFTDFHRYARSPRNSVVNISRKHGTRFMYIVKFLNYAFFERKISKLDDLTADVICDFLNRYGRGDLMDDNEDTARSEATVRACVSAIMDFVELYIDDKKTHPKMKKDDLYTWVNRRDKKTGQVHKVKTPKFEVVYTGNGRMIYRDIPEQAFNMIFGHIREKHKDILMLVALSAFCGLRPSEACNVRRADSQLGPGILFDVINGHTQRIFIDLKKEMNLRSDRVLVGSIKKERKQEMPDIFVNAFVETYNEYMDYMNGKRYEADYGALTVNSRGMAMTYERYRQIFSGIIHDEIIPMMLASNEPELVIYGRTLMEHNISPHIFRHWYTVQLVLSGVNDPGTLMYYRGDKSPESALTYLQNKSELEKQFRKVNNEMFNYSRWAAEERHDRY